MIINESWLKSKWHENRMQFYFLSLPKCFGYWWKNYSEFHDVCGLEEADVLNTGILALFLATLMFDYCIWFGPRYRQKRHPDGTLLKHKAQICVDGSRHCDGIDYFANEMYSPVCQWSSVRLTLFLLLFLVWRWNKLTTCRLSCKPHLIPMCISVFLEAGNTFRQRRTLINSSMTHLSMIEMVYQVKEFFLGNQAGSCYSSMLISVLLAWSRLYPEYSDLCLWISDNCIIWQYVDDCLIFAHDDSILDLFLATM